MMISVLAVTMDHVIQASSGPCMSRMLKVARKDRSSLLTSSASLGRSHAKKRQPLRRVFKATGEPTASDTSATSKHIDLSAPKRPSDHFMHNNQME